MKTLLLILLPFVASCQIMPGIIGSSKKQNPQEPAPTVFAGPDQTIQDDETVQLDGVGPDGSTWTTSGDGSFNDDELLNAVYTPGATDISNGSVVLTLSFGELSDAMTVIIQETVEGFTYVPIPSPPSFSNTQTLSSGSTGNSVTFAELGGKTDLLINGNYDLFQANGWGDNVTYRARSQIDTDPSTWAWLGQFGADLPAAGISNTGTTMPNIELYNIKIHHADAGIKWGPYSATRSQKYQNIVIDSTGFAGMQINSAGDGLFYGDLTISFLMGSYTEGELTYLGRTGGAEVSLFKGVTTISHVYGYHIGREAIQCNGHREVHVSHVTAFGDGVNLGEGDGQNNPCQFQNDSIGSLKKSIFADFLSPGVFAVNNFVCQDNYFHWKLPTRPVYMQNMVANSYDSYVSPGGTVSWEGVNIYDNPDYTGSVVFLLQDPTCNYHFKDTIYVPLSATDHYADQRISPTGSIIDEAVWIETNNPPRPTFGLPPEEEYQPYQKVVTHPWFILKGMGFRSLDPE
jgi:hypothetical protein